MIVKVDVGDCPICGAAHTTCTAVTGPIVVRQLPARDAIEPMPLVAEVVQATLPAGSFTSGTYRRDKKKP